MEIPSALEYMARIKRVMGIPAGQDSTTLHLTWNNREEGKALIQRIREMQKELRLIKQEVTATISAVKSEFASARTQVGKGFGAGLAAGFFGRKAMGSVNASEKDRLRRKQADFVRPYEAAKHEIDQFLATLDRFKGKIELSPEYRVAESKAQAKVLAPWALSALPPRAAPKYFVFLNEDVKGPYTKSQLATLLDAGTITPETQVCPEGTEEWRFLSSLPTDYTR